MTKPRRNREQNVAAAFRLRFKVRQE